MVVGEAILLEYKMKKGESLQYKVTVHTDQDFKMTDQNFNLGGIAGIPWQATGGMQYGGTTVVTQPADGVSHADIQRVEEKADDSLRMHAKTRDLLKKIAK